MTTAIVVGAAFVAGTATGAILTWVLCVAVDIYREDHPTATEKAQETGHPTARLHAVEEDE